MIPAQSNIVPVPLFGPLMNINLPRKATPQKKSITKGPPKKQLQSMSVKAGGDKETPIRDRCWWTFVRRGRINPFAMTPQNQWVFCNWKGLGRAQATQALEGCDGGEINRFYLLRNKFSSPSGLR